MIPEFHEYTISEILKHAELQEFYSEKDVKIIKNTIDDEESFFELIPEADASSNQYPINYFKQPRVDVYGGSGFDGSNFPYIVNGEINWSVLIK